MIEQSVTPSDEQLMAEISADGAAGLERLYDRYGARAYTVAISICRDEGHAQEAVQDAFLAVWTHRGQYDARRGTVVTWLMTVVRYRAIDLIRLNQPHAARRASEAELEGRVSPTDVCQTTIERDEAEHLHAQLSLLPESQQQVVTLAFYGQLTHAEIATRLGLPAGTVKGRMRLGLQKLRQSCQQTVL